MDSSWMDAAWTVWIDWLIQVTAAAGLLVASLGLLLAMLAPQRLRDWPFRYGVKRAARTRRHAGIEFSLWMLVCAGLLSSLLGQARPGWMILLTPLALFGLFMLRAITGSRAGRRPG